MRNRARLAVLLLAPASLLIAGCVEATLTYTLNPDGSGKVKVDAVLPARFGEFVSATGGEEPKQKQREPETAAQLDEMLKDTVTDILEDSEGVTAWKNVSAEFRDDGKVHFVGTAYFDDLDELDLENIPALSPNLIRSEDRALTLVLEEDDSDKSDEDEPERKRDPRKMSDAELDRYILLQRAQYQRSRGMLVAALTEMEIESVFQLPGPVGEVRVFERLDDKSVSTRLKGKQVLDAVDQFMAHDNAWFRRRIRQKGRVTFPEADQLKKFGLNLDDAKATVPAPKEPQFNYEKELAAARKEYSKIKKKYDLDSKPEPADIKVTPETPEEPPTPSAPIEVPDEKD